MAARAGCERSTAIRAPSSERPDKARDLTRLSRWEGSGLRPSKWRQRRRCDGLDVFGMGISGRSSVSTSLATASEMSMVDELNRMRALEYGPVAVRITGETSSKDEPMSLFQIL